MAESFSRQKLRQAPQKEGGEILCDPGWYVHKPDVQNKWDDNTRTYIHRIPVKLYVFVCVVIPFILDVRCGSTNRGQTGSPSSFCCACLSFSREKDSTVPFPRRP